MSRKSGTRLGLRPLRDFNGNKVGNWNYTPPIRRELADAVKNVSLRKAS
jgi:hypothetical protein